MTQTSAASPGTEPSWEQLLSGAGGHSPAPPSPPRGTTRREIELPAWERDEQRADLPDVVRLPGTSEVDQVDEPPEPAEEVDGPPAPGAPAGHEDGTPPPAPTTVAARPSAPEPLTQDLAGAESDQLRELEERVADVLRHPEDLRSVHAPVVDLRSGACAGYEAAVRVAQWPARDPRPWLRAAARAGLAAQLEAAGLAAALRARLTMPGDRLTVVRVSGASVRHPAVLRVLGDEDDLGRVLVCVDPAPDDAVADLVEAFDLLRQHGALAGLRLVEAGRSELVAVEATRPDVVSLDRAFAVDVHSDRARQQLIGTVTDVVGDEYGMVLAEDVEAVADARCLRDCGVQLAQGWLFGRPRPGFLPPPADTADWLADRADRTGPVPRQRTDALPGTAADG